VAWQGWAFFGGTVMARTGLLRAGLGLVALVDQQYFAVRANRLFVVHG